MDTDKRAVRPATQGLLSVAAARFSPALELPVTLKGFLFLLTPPSTRSLAIGRFAPYHTESFARSFTCKA